MRYLFSILVFASITISCNQPETGTNGVAYKSAVEYNDYIVGRQSLLMRRLIDMEKISQTDLDSAEKILDEMILKTDKMIIDLRGMPAYKSDSLFRNTAVNSFLFYKKIMGTSYKRIIEIRRNGEDSTQEGVAELNNIIDQMKREEEKYDKAFHNAQQSFAEKNNMMLKENEIQKQIDESS